MFEKNETHVSGILVALSLGALAGAGLTLLVAPRSGKKTRELIADKSKELTDKAKEKLHDATDFMGDKSQEFKNKAKETINDAQSFIKV